MNRNLTRHFAERAAAYDQAAWVHDPQVMDATLEFISPQPGERILDVGAGTGAVLESVLAVCPDIGECAAVDISPEMLAHIRHPDIRLFCNDAEELPFPDARFDVAVCRQTLHYIDNLDRCLGEIRRVLCPDGALVIGQMTPFAMEDEDYWKTIVHLRQPLRRHDLTAPELADLLRRNRFDVVRRTQIRVRESLNSWLARYKDSDRQLDEVRRMHVEAPESYKRIHRFEFRADDVLVDNCWTFIRACKARETAAD